MVPHRPPGPPVPAPPNASSTANTSAAKVIRPTSFARRLSLEWSPIGLTAVRTVSSIVAPLGGGGGGPARRGPPGAHAAVAVQWVGCGLAAAYLDGLIARRRRPPIATVSSK